MGSHVDAPTGGKKRPSEQAEGLDGHEWVFRPK